MVEALGITLKEFIFYTINFLILVFVLGKFLYKPFLGMLEKRRDFIQDSLDRAEQLEKDAEAMKAEYEGMRESSERECREIIADARIKAEAQASEIVKEAREKAEAIVSGAEIEIRKAKDKALSDMRGEITGLALMAAEKILEKEVETTGQEQIVDKIIEEAGVSRWQS